MAGASNASLNGSDFTQTGSMEDFTETNLGAWKQWMGLCSEFITTSNHSTPRTGPFMVLIKTLQDQQPRPHFTQEKTGSERGSGLPEATQCVAEMGSEPRCLTQPPFSLPIPPPHYDAFSKGCQPPSVLGSRGSLTGGGPGGEPGRGSGCSRPRGRGGGSEAHCMTQASRAGPWEKGEPGACPPP